MNINIPHLFIAARCLTTLALTKMPERSQAEVIVRMETNLGDVLNFIDGERGDSDLTANGVIVNPGGPGVAATASAASGAGA